MSWDLIIYPIISQHIGFIYMDIRVYSYVFFMF